ncbi:hypothetical protein FRB90_002049, partial [Tulasnella sp. 427]
MRRNQRPPETFSVADDDDDDDYGPQNYSKRTAILGKKHTEIISQKTGNNLNKDNKDVDGDIDENDNVNGNGNWNDNGDWDRLDM